jgi:hypothetical protein
MPADLGDLIADVSAETSALRAILDLLGQAKFARPTSAAGWSIADHVSHLAYFDEVAVTSATDAYAFAASLARVNADGGVNPDTVAAQFRKVTTAPADAGPRQYEKDSDTALSCTDATQRLTGPLLPASLQGDVPQRRSVARAARRAAPR